MATSAVSPVLYLRDSAGNHAETRSGAYIHYGDAASLHKWEFRTRLRTAGFNRDQYIEEMTMVCAGLRGEAFVAAREIGFDNWCEIVDGRPCPIDTLISNICEEWFSLQLNMNLKNCSASTVLLEDPCADKMERVYETV